jgi:hypothetical protein
MKKKLIISIIAMLSIIFFSLTGCLFNNYSFEISSKLYIPNSTYHVNGTWWGYHQSKIVSIGDTTFTYYINNSTQINSGQANIINPNKAVFLKIKDGVKEEFGFANTSRPCNVLADTQRNKVYFVVVEPTSNVDSGTMGKIVLYTYSFNSESSEITFDNKADVIQSGDNGQIRTAATIDSSGNIAITHGGYDSYMYIYILNIESGKWADYKYLSNNEYDELLYPYIILKDIDTFYLLAVQDTNVEGTNYYQYVKFFAYDNGVWSSEMVVDYRNLEIAASKPQLVEQTEFYMDGEDIHIITRARLSEKGDSVVKHFIYNNSELSEVDASFLDNDYSWVKLLRFQDELYYICTVSNKLIILDYKTQKTVFSTKVGFKGSYVYINKNWNENEMEIMLLTGNSEDFDRDNLILYIIPKE